MVEIDKLEIAEPSYAVTSFSQLGGDWSAGYHVLLDRHRLSVDELMTLPDEEVRELALSLYDLDTAVLVFGLRRRTTALGRAGFERLVKQKPKTHVALYCAVRLIRHGARELTAIEHERQQTCERAQRLLDLTRRISKLPSTYQAYKE